MMRNTALLLPALMLATSAFAQTAPATRPATSTPTQSMPAQTTPAQTTPTQTTPAQSMPGKMTAGRTGMSMKGMGKVAVNTATEAQLSALPGVGPKLAAEMIKARPFKNSADLIRRVKGIGSRNYVKLGLNKELTF